MLFKGSLNSIVLRRKYSARYSCPLNLALYPFDTQVRALLLINEVISNDPNLLTKRMQSLWSASD